MKKSLIISALALTFAACTSNAPQTTNTESHEHHDHEANKPVDTIAITAGQNVFFPNLEDGQEIKLPYIVKFGVEGMEVKPAAMAEPNVGHHHLVVDGMCVTANTMVPMGKEAEGCYHFGKGQTQDTLNLKKYPMLTPGKHTLTLQFATGMHMSYGPAMSKTVNIVVK